MATILLILLNCFGESCFKTFSIVFLIIEIIGITILIEFKTHSESFNISMSNIAKFLLILIKLIILVVFFEMDFSVSMVSVVFIVLGGLDFIAIFISSITEKKEKKRIIKSIDLSLSFIVVFSILEIMNIVSLFIPYSQI